jgi:hypothetical protein
VPPRDTLSALVGGLPRWLVVLGLGAFTMTWAMTVPPRGYPDEQDHYLRALAVGGGDLTGRPDPELAATARTPVPKACCVPDGPVQRRWVALGVRRVDVPAELTPGHLPCLVGTVLPPRDPCGVPPPTHGRRTVEQVTSMGTIEPLPYLLPGFVARLASNPTTALRLGRGIDALVTAAMVAFAASALLDRERSLLALAGLTAATTPMLTFVGGSLSPSALEVTSGLAVFALLLRVARGGARRGTWVQLAIAGALLVTSRSLGTVWIALDVLVVVALIGARPLVARLRAAGPAALVATAVVAAASVSTVVWERVRQPGIDVDGSFFVQRIGPSLADLPRIRDEVVGVFALLTVRMPSGAYLAWELGVLLLVGAALAVGTSRQRIVLVGVITVNVVAAVVASAGLLNQNGFGLQGRHVLAFAVTIPLLSGEILAERLDPRRWSSLALAVVTVVGAVTVHAIAFRAAGHQLGWLTRHPAPGQLVPPGGALLWALVIGAGAACLVAATMLTAWSGRDGSLRLDRPVKKA